MAEHLGRPPGPRRQATHADRAWPLRGWRLGVLALVALAWTLLSTPGAAAPPAASGRTAAATREAIRPRPRATRTSLPRQRTPTAIRTAVPPTRTRTVVPTATPGGSCGIFPADNIWQRNISHAPVHVHSAAYLASINQHAELAPGFGSRLWQGQTIGNPITIVGPGQPLVPIHYTEYPEQSDPGPFPVPAGARVEGGSSAGGDRHVIVWDQGRCAEYDLFNAFRNRDGSWNAGSGARWALTSDALRPDGWTSADAAGLPLLPGLIRYDEVLAGRIGHAIRFVAGVNGVSVDHVWPARHSDGQSSSTTAMPMGSRLRLKATVDLSGYDPQTRVILRALQTYGMILADTDWSNAEISINGDVDSRWNDDLLQSMRQLHAGDFDVVDVSGLMVDANSGQSR